MELFQGADLSFYIMILVAFAGYHAIKIIRNKFKQHRHTRQLRIDAQQQKIKEQQRVILEEKEMEKYRKEMLEKIEKEGFWFE